MPDQFRSKESFRVGDEWLSTGGAAGASGVDSPPTVASLTPSSVGNVATPVVVAGTFLSDVTAVNYRLGASGASGVITPTIDGPTKLTFIADFAVDGTYGITVTSPDGTSTPAVNLTVA